MLQTAPPPLRESSSVARWSGVARGVGATKVKRTGQRQPRAGGQLDLPQFHRRAGRRPPTEPPGPSPRPGVAAGNGVPATLRIAEAAGVLGKIPAQPADAACRTPSPPGRGQLCRLTREVRSSIGNGAFASPLTGVKAPSPPLARDARVVVGRGRWGARRRCGVAGGQGRRGVGRGWGLARRPGTLAG
jgi:hypothetical protein